MTETTRDLVEVAPDTRALVDVETGEALAPTVENAARVLDAARRMKDRLGDVVTAATDVVRDAAQVYGSKTFHLDDGVDVVLTGGPAVEYDPLALADLLREAGCPEERIDAAIKAEVTYKVDRNVLKQLTGANEDYKAAAAVAERPIEKPWRASTKVRR